MNPLDNKKTLFFHKNLIRSKGFLNKLYTDFYLEFKNTSVPSGKVVELGSGAGFIKEIIFKTITTDVISDPDIDIVLKGDQLPFAKNSVSAFFLLDVLHHIKNPEKFLREMQRCLKKNGKIIMIEPYNSLWGRFIYQNFHHENFDPSAGWEIKGKGRLSNANGAIPWIIFVRDRQIFIKKFPNLKVTKIRPHTPLRYLLSGGLSKPQFAPSFLYNPIFNLEKLLSPISNVFSMFVTIELKKLN